MPNPANPQSWNRYAYAYNNPIKYVDPSGHTGNLPPNPFANINIHFTDGWDLVAAMVCLVACALLPVHYEQIDLGHGAIVGDSPQQVAEKSFTALAVPLTITSSTPSIFDDIYSGSPQYSYDVRTGQYRDMATGKFVSPDDIPWPSKGGFASDPVKTEIAPGTVIDRLGKLDGQYASTPGASVSARGMAPGSEYMPYTKLRVVEKVTVSAGPAASVPEFGAAGGAMQYQFKGGIESYIKKGILEVIK